LTPTELKMPTLRTTAMQSFQECPKRWSVEHVNDDGDIDTEDQEGNEYSIRGTAVHDVINHVIFRRLDVSDEGLWDLCENKLKVAKVPPKERQNCRDYCGEILQRLNDPNWKLLQHETKFFMEICPGAPPVKGTPDIVWYDCANGCYVITDHKTNRKFEDADVWRHRLQQKTYVWAIRRSLLDTVKHPWLLKNERVIDFEIGYVNLGTTVRWRTSIRDDIELVRTYQNLWSDLQVYHRTGEWPERINDYCGFCPCLETCKTAQELVADVSSLFEETPAMSDLKRLQQLQQTMKLAEATEKRLKERVMVRARDGAYEEDGLQAEIKTTSRRAAEAWPVLMLLEEWNNEEWPKASLINSIFTVKVGELDKIDEGCLSGSMEENGIIKRNEQERLVITPVKK